MRILNISYVDVGDAYIRFPMSYDTSNVVIYTYINTYIHTLIHLIKPIILSHGNKA